jgi:hypothetical protein
MLSLRTALLVDAAASGAMGLLCAAAAAPIAQALLLPEPLLRWAGLALLPFAALLVWLAGRATSPGRGLRRALWLVVVGNALWAIDSVLLLLTGWVSPNALGAGFVLAQAVAVAGFTWFEASGLRETA